MTKVERLKKAISDHQGYLKSIDEQIQRDTLQIEQNKDTAEQVNAIIEAMTYQLQAWEPVTEPVPIPSQG